MLEFVKPIDPKPVKIQLLPNNNGPKMEKNGILVFKTFEQNVLMFDEGSVLAAKVGSTMDLISHND